jgi:alkylation response protein AidB-like acyl-CoA dehydrogenase
MFEETVEQTQLRQAVSAMARRYGHSYFVGKAKSGEHTHELWDEAGKLGYLGVSVPTEYGGGGGGITELAIVCEELAAAGCPLLLLVVSPAIAGTILAKHGTSRAAPALPARHRRRLAQDRVRDHLNPRPARTSTGSPPPPAATATSGSSMDASASSPASTRPSTSSWWPGPRTPAPVGWHRRLFVLPTDAPGLTRSQLEMEIVSPENQFLLYLDEVRVPGGRADRRRHRGGPARVVRRAQPGADHGGRDGHRHRPVRAGAGVLLRVATLGLGPPHRLPPRGRPPAGARADPGRSWPG